MAAAVTTVPSAASTVALTKFAACVRQHRLTTFPLEMAKCMRARGIVGSPDPSSQGGFKVPVPVAEGPTQLRPRCAERPRHTSEVHDHRGPDVTLVARTS